MALFDPRFDPRLFPPDQLVNSLGMPYSRSLLNMPQDQKDAVARSMAYIKAAQQAGRNPYAVGGDSAPQDRDYGGGGDPVPAATTAPTPARGLSAGGALAIPARGTPEREALKSLIYKYESMGGQNVPNYRFDPTHTAQGIGQITNSTWRDVAQTDPIVGQFSNAMSAPTEVQDRAVDDLIDKRGVSPWAPYNPKLSAALAKVGYKTGLSTPGNNNMLPSFGAARLLAQLTPQAPGTDPAVGGFTPTAPDSTDALSQLQNLLKGGSSYGLGYNPQKLLASMAAGFLGGKGPAQSLAGGFGGAASSTKDDTTEQMGLLKMAMMYGPIMQQQIKAKQLASVAAATRQGQMPVSMAAQQQGMTPKDFGADNWDAVDNAYRSGMPLPATAQKAIQDATGGIASQRNNQIQLKTIRDQIANGDFQLDAMHRAEYHILNTLGIPTEASSKFQAMQQTLGNMQADLMNSQKGAASDKRAELALSQLTGGGGLTSNAQAINHFDYLGNHAALAEKNLRQKLEQSYTLSKQKMPADFMAKLDATLPASPYQGVDPNVIGRQLYGDNTTNPGTTAAPGQPLAGNTPTAAPVGNANGALPPGAIRLPDGRIAIPKTTP